jgi:tetratricopeptide (TPR) repeat protein
MASSDLPNYRIFISSPRDVAQERGLALDVISRLNGEYEKQLRLVPVAWEAKTYGAHADFQAQIVATATCHLVIGIFWNKIGQALDAERYGRPDGGPPYESGSVFEIETALNQRQRATLPDVALFKKEAPLAAPLTPAEAEELTRNLKLMEAVTNRWLRTEARAFKAAYNKFSTPAQFEALMEMHLRAWLEQRGHTSDGVVWRIRGDQDTPYPRLSAYDADRASVFCGREQALGLCLQDLRDAARRGCAFLLVLGASGAGKSSLARAGLMPRLARSGSAPGVDKWRTAVFLLGRDPVSALAQALFLALPELADGDSPTPAIWASTVQGSAEAAAGSVAAALRRVGQERERGSGQAQPEPRRVNLAVLADQLEEAFVALPPERMAFAAVLSALACSGVAWVVATLRDDRYPALLEQPTLVALKRNGATHDLAAPAGGDIDAIIREPARLSGLRFEAAADGHDLAQELRREVSGADALPLLQMTLARLFEERDRSTGTLTFAAYDTFGRLAGAIDEQAEKVFASADVTTQAELPALLLALVGGVSEEGGVLAREALEADVADTPARASLLRLMVGGRLLLTDGREGSDGVRRIWVRVAHEALLRNWVKAANILKPETLRAKPRVEQALRDWQYRGRRESDLLRGTQLEAAKSLVEAHGAALPDPLTDFVSQSVAAGKRTVTRARRRLRFTQAAAVVFAIVAGLAYYQQRQAAAQRVTAERNLGLALDAATRTIEIVQREGTPGGGTSTLFGNVPRNQITQGVMLNFIQVWERILGEIESFQKQEEIEIAIMTLQDQLSEAYLFANDIKASLRAAERALDLSQRLGVKYASDPRFTGVSLRALHRIAGGNRVAGEPEKVFPAASKEVAMADDPKFADLTDPQSKWYRAFAHEGLGDALRWRDGPGDSAEAMANYSLALDIYNTIPPMLKETDISAANADQRRATVRGKISDIMLYDCRQPEASENAKENLNLMTSIQARFPDISSFQHSGAIAYERLGFVAFFASPPDLAASEKMHKATLERMTKLLGPERSTRSIAFSRTVSLAYFGLGNVYPSMADTEVSTEGKSRFYHLAYQNYQSYRSIVCEIADESIRKQDPNRLYQRECGIAYRSLASAAQRNEEFQSLSEDFKNKSQQYPDLLRQRDTRNPSGLVCPVR